MKNKLKIGFIGQGFVGKNLADNFESRRFSIVRFSLEPQFIKNRNKIGECDVVFIAVPTPTTPKGFDGRILEKVISLVGPGKIAIIKSTIVPGFTEKLQKKNEKIILLHSPEFLSEATAKYDTDHPFANVVGVAKKNPKYEKAARLVLGLLPKAKFSSITTSAESEIIKYAHNCGGFVQIVYFNMLYDLTRKRGADWKLVEAFIKADPLIPNRYANPVHKSGRGAGGHCFIKDFSAFIETYEKLLPKDRKSIKALKAFQDKNIELLISTRKDLKLLSGVHGKKVLNKR